jgi:hypothetical protein
MFQERVTLVGWAIRALTPVFDGLWALALPSIRMRELAYAVPTLS